MATMLYLNPAGQLVEVVQQQQNIFSYLQTSEPNLSDIDTSAGSGKGQGGGMGMLLPLLLIFMVMMLFLPKRQDKEGEKFRNALQLDQDVVTSSGIFGKIKAIDEVSVILEIAQNMRIKVDKRYVNPVPVPQPVKPEKKSKKAKDPSKDEKA